MKKLFTIAFLVLFANAQAQTFPVNNLVVNGTANLNGGTTVTSSFTATGLVTNADLATQAANTLLGNFTGGVASPTATAMGSGVPTALTTGANASGGVILSNGAITPGNCLKWSASGIQDTGVANCIYDANVINPRNFGALGNSNGTHGNGNDDTTAFQNALNAAPSKSMFIPCGTYRITAPLTITDANPRWIFGNGECTQIYSDQTIAAPTLNFNPAGTCGAGSNAPCLVMTNMVFLQPNTGGAGQVAVNLSKTNSPFFDSVTFISQQIGIAFANSFAPRVQNSRFYSGNTGISSTDISFNSGDIWSSSFFNQTTAISIVPSSGCAVAFSIRNNDIEQNGTALTLAGMCSGDISNNYLEASHTQTVFNFGSSGGGLQNVTFANNSINGATDSGTGSEVITNLLSSQFINNSFFNWVVSYGSGVGRVRMRATENYLVATTLPTTTTGTCTGLGTGGTCTIGFGDDWSGYVSLTTGTAPAAAGAIAINFTNALGPNKAHCSFTPITNTGSWSSPTIAGNSASPTSTGVVWTNSGALTASVNYLMGYQCTGY